ncbi:MAG: HDOD domain-containing protein [Rhodoferax sp.]|nr:HDOD domain-containing protein [Rhodoferax sp.]
MNSESAIQSAQSGVATATTGDDPHHSSALEALLRRMRSKSDFPALSESISRIQNMATSVKESIYSVTNEILKDVALTNKLLRLVNSVHYARGNSVGTVSRAVSLVGFNGIRNLTLSLMLLEHMDDKGNAQLLKEEFLRALMAGTIAAELAASQTESEEAFIGALFQNLGRMLAQFYFADEAASIRQLVGDAANPISEEVAARRVLSLSFEQLGLGVAKAWGLPDSIQHCMVRLAGDPPVQRSPDAVTQLRWSARAANDMADAMLHADPEVVDQQLAILSKSYSRALAMAPDRVRMVTTRARVKLTELADAMEIRVPSHSIAARLLRAPADTGVAPADAAQRGATADAIDDSALQVTHGVDPVSGDKVGSQTSDVLARTEMSTQTLAAGIQDITDVMVDDFKLPDVLRMILEAMFRALGFHRVIFCMRDPKTNVLTGRFGLGQDVEKIVKSFYVPLSCNGVPDLFATICSKAADTLITDSSDPRIAARLPAWYQRNFHAPGFLILPLVIKSQPVGLIYADMLVKGALTIDEKQLSLLRTLRNQAIMAFKQSS